MQVSKCDGPIEYIDHQRSLEALARDLEQVPRVALDTEADSLHHYYEKVCLIQLSFAGRHVLIDPLTPLELSPVLNILATKTLVIHGADYDLRLLYRCYGFKAWRVFDTMLAAQFLGFPHLGLASLVERTCGVVLSKHGQKANWAQRPLPPDLIEYASNDTRHLLCVADRLSHDLELRGRQRWHEEACQKLVEVTTREQAPKKAEPWKVKGWSTLRPGRAHAILKELWQWREREAQLADVPPFKIIRNEVMIALIRAVDEEGKAPPTLQVPKNIRGPRYERFLSAFEKALNLPEARWPHSGKTKHREQTPRQRDLFQRLRELRNNIAKSHGIDPALLCPSSALTVIAEARPTSQEAFQNISDLCPWQVELLADPFLATIAQPTTDFSVS